MKIRIIPSIISISLLLVFGAIGSNLYNCYEKSTLIKNLNESQESFYIENIFPETGLCRIENASELAETILMRLGIYQVIQPIWETPINESALLTFRSPDAPHFAFDMKSWGSRQMAFSFGEKGIITLYYDNLNSSNNEFLAFRSILNDSEIIVTNTSDYKSVSEDVIDLLGIPTDNLTVTLHRYNFDAAIIPPPEFYKYYSEIININDLILNYSEIIFSSKFSNHDLTGCNIIALTFNNDTGKLVKIESTLFVTLPPNLPITSEEALEIGRVTSPSAYSHFTDADVWEIERDEITGIRIVPMISNATIERDFTLAYEYQARIVKGTWDPSWWVLVIIDAFTGHVYYSMLESGGIPGEKGFVIPSYWIGVAMVFATIVLFSVGMMIGPPEISIGLIGTFLPLYLRIRGINALENFNRGRIHGYIAGKPGCSFTELKKELGIFNGNLAYHLMILEKFELIKSVKDGHKRRFFLQNTSAKISMRQRLGKMESRILKQLIEAGPFSASEIAEAFEISRQRTHYNLKQLKKHGLAEYDSGKWRALSNGSETTDVNNRGHN